MSYSFTVTKTATGLTVACPAPEHVPDGVYEVGGHEDPLYRSIAVTRRDTGGTAAQVQAYGYAYAAAPAPVPAAPAADGGA